MNHYYISREFLYRALLPRRRCLPEPRARELRDGPECSLSCVQPEAKIAVGKTRKDIGRLMVRRVPARADFRSTLQLTQADRRRQIPNAPESVFAM